MITVIMAGGMGTRISSVASDIPKPMIRLDEKPILEYQMECLKKQGITDIILVIGHLGDKIVEYFGDGSSFGLKITYIKEEIPLGTAGALHYVDKMCRDESAILLLNGDVIFDVDIMRFYRYHLEKKADITLFTHPNNHPYDSSLIITDHEGKIINWLNKEDPRNDYKNRVNAGLHIIERHALVNYLDDKRPIKLDLDRDIIKSGLDAGDLSIYAYDSPEYVKDMGTPERYLQVSEDLYHGIVKSKSLLNRQRAIFLDRDGTINKHPGGIHFITSPDEMELMAGAASAIRKINQSGYLAIVVTNQPVIARGDCTFDELEAIHQRMERLLGEEGAYLDDIIFCPHHPDSGFEGERPEYKIECECRKPKPGMFFEMAERYNIDLSRSFMIGDHARDLKAGKNAGCRTCFVDEGTAAVDESLFDYKESDLLRAVERILEEG